MSTALTGVAIPGSDAVPIKGCVQLPLRGRRPVLRCCISRAAWPYAISSRYLDRLPREDIWHFAKFDHRCGWVEAWPETYGRIRTLLR